MSDYNAGIQNWSIAQDERGVMYFGNNNGLLEFDGSAWRLYELPTKGIVRAIYISKDGRIYVGSYEEFGYSNEEPSTEFVPGWKYFLFSKNKRWTLCLCR